MAKASDNVFPKVILEEAAAPAAGAAGTVKLYAKADGLLYSKDDAGVETLVSGGAGGGAVATDAIWDAKGDLAGGTGANTAARLAVGANDTVLTADSSTATGLKWAAPSGGSTWTQVITETGTSFANFTSAAGTWSSDGTVIKQTNTGAANYYAKYNTLINNAHFIFEAEIMVKTANMRAGLLTGWPGTNTANHMGFEIYQNAGVNIVNAGNSISVTATATINVDTWYKIRGYVTGHRVAIWLDGTLVLIGHHAGVADMRHVGLIVTSGDGHFRNIKAWTPSGLPA